MLDSPLRYPGSKKNLTPYIAAVMRKNLLLGGRFIEPFAGGASSSLFMLEKGLAQNVSIIERDPLISSFWKTVFNEPDRLCDRIRRIRVTLNNWKAMSKYLDEEFSAQKSDFERGVAGLFLNRTSFSGILGAGPIGGMRQLSDYSVACRFNKRRIVDQIIRISKYGSRVSVISGDALSYLKKMQKRLERSHCFVYVDPPYYQQGRRLYRYHYEHDDHVKLAKFLQSASFPWLTSYDLTPQTKELFNGRTQQRIWLDYRVKSARFEEELLVSNVDIPKPSKRH